jgi:hypothetical protein
MIRRLIRRRRDGLVEIRRARARDLVVANDAIVLAALLAGFFFFAVLLVMTLVFDPPFLAVGGWVVLALAVEQRARRPSRLAPVPPSPPPRSAA